MKRIIILYVIYTFVVSLAGTYLLVYVFLPWLAAVLRANGVKGI